MGLGAVVRSSTIEIVLPVFNGVNFLSDQIASIADQSLKPERVLARDDGSTDGSLTLLEDLQSVYGDHWLQIIPGDGIRLGCVGNVNRLLELTTAPYVALADQDDLWFANKLEILMELMLDYERSYGSESPLLVHADLELIDAQDCSLGTTYLRRQRLDVTRIKWADLAITNVVTGCSALVNRALIERSLPIPAEALMHDWWLALVSAAFGGIGYSPQPCMGYRQHGFNVLGSQGVGLNYWRTRLWTVFHNSSGVSTLGAVVRQAQVFEDRYGKQSFLLLKLMALPRRSRVLKLFSTPCRDWPSKHGPLRTVCLYVLIAILPRTSIP